ncbi:hypothetical protein [Stenotrophomonas maltophilia]|uniref:hypothetical protein n=1 Tax=Stenotrophomonas maltophilia TaxID=40324 RepID=UPI0011B6BFBC|nr:hypothetical protein [Stenotrophomonas maltophilia]MBB5529982.1 hypothetical protein [Stenotrophomonas maltophilia]
MLAETAISGAQQYKQVPRLRNEVLGLIRFFGSIRLWLRLLAWLLRKLEPCDMVWWSLTCNIEREWRLMMAEAAPRVSLSPKSILQGEI